QLAAFLAGHPEATELALALSVPPTLDALTRELERALDDAGELLDAASPELARARERARRTKAQLRALLGRLVARYGDALRESFYTEYDGRYALPVRTDAPYRVEGIVLGASGSGGTLYIEPREATEAGNHHRVALADVERETARVLG